MEGKSGLNDLSRGTPERGAFQYASRCGRRSYKSSHRI